MNNISNERVIMQTTELQLTEAEIPKIYVLDTNIILEDIQNVFKLYNNENEIIIPSIVIDELDSKKTDLGELGFRAREFARFIDESELVLTTKKENLIYTILYNKKYNIKFKIADLEFFESKIENTNINILNDNKIIEIAKHIPDSILVSLDSMCRIRGMIKKVNTETLTGTKEEPDFEFIKEISITDIPDIILSPEGDIFEGTFISSIDPEYTPDNFNYLVHYPSGKTKAFQVFNDKLYSLDEDEILKQDIKPLNLGQKLLVGAMISDFTDIIVSDALAGSGKSLLAISTAIRLVQKKKYNKIIYIRNSIESTDRGEEVGFLPGLEEKFAIYNHPLYDSLRFIAREQLKKSNTNKSIKTHIDEDKVEERAQELVKKNNIETMWVGEMRGRTLSDAVIIMDEVQNFSKRTLQLCLSRVDKTCKVIVMGSNRQIDNIYTNKYTNGLTALLNATKEKHTEVRLHACKLTKVLRGPITAFAERVFSS